MIQKQIFFLLTFLALTYAAEPDPTLEDFFRDSINAFKEKMPTGIPELNITRLEPYVHKPKIFEEGTKYKPWLYKVWWRLRGLEVTYLSHFQVKDISIEQVQGKSISMNFEFFWPVIQAVVSYDFEARLFFIPTYLYGTPSVTLSKAHLLINATFLKNETQLQMTTFDISLNYEGLKIRNVGYLWVIGDLIASTILDHVFYLVSKSGIQHSSTFDIHFYRKKIFG